MAWYDFFISQRYGVNGEQGIDLATPFHTPITNLYQGKVVEAQYGSAGGIVGILTNVPGLGQVVEYFLHLDLINVKVGQNVAIGQQVGLSGGENPGFPGGLHPASPQFSTGPHTEFGFFKGLPFQSQNAGNPQSFLHPGTGGTSATSPTNTHPSVSGNCPQMQWYDWFDPVKLSEWSACQGLQKGTQIQNLLSNPFGFLLGGLATSLENLGFFILALVAIAVGVILIAYEPAKQAVQDTVKGAFVA